jgi:two-component system chemotaxis sensor kinase CheA
MSPKDLAARLLATFVDELEEQVRTLNAELLALETTPDDAARLQSVFRVAHTLKGAARAANVPLAEHVCHRLEAVLAETRDGRARLDAGTFETLFAAADALADAGRRLRAGQPLDDSPLAELARRLSSGEPAVRAGSRARPAPPPAPTPPTPTPTIAAPTPAGDDQVRIPSDKLDGLLATTGQLLVSVQRAHETSEEIGAMQEVAGRVASEWRRQSGSIRQALERTAASREVMTALTSLESDIQQLARDVARGAQRAAQESRTLGLLSTDLMDRGRKLRMRPFAEAVEALPRAVRDVAAATGKEAELRVEGTEIEADRVILEALRESLLHLVRNAVDHGIELPDERARLGKPRQGSVVVRAGVRGDQLQVRVADDGRGLDTRAIRARLVSLGRDVPADDATVAQILFEGGFSTRREATEISGRGVGLDVVRATMARVRGSVDVSWNPGQGTTFTLLAPLTLATVRAMLVGVGSQIMAIPTGVVERLMRLDPSEVRQIDGQHVLPTPDGPVPLATMARLLGPPLPERPVEGHLLVVLLAVGQRRAGVVVDALLAEEELVIRPLERLRQPIARLSGAALLPNGRVALVVNPGALVRRGAIREATVALQLSKAPAAPERRTRRRILVVDDSLTTRTLEQSVLEAAGYEVLTAVDGADAWRVLQERGADLVVSDIEMPRMDGFALTESIRQSRLGNLPVVLVTSLESPEHQARGLEVGADAYIVKSSFDQASLLDTIRQLLR